MSLKRLTVFVVLVELVALGVLFSFLLAAIIAQGGRVTFDMTYFNEKWIEYFAIMAIVGVTPYVLYLTDQWWGSGST